jgi:hypothetical protein
MVYRAKHRDLGRRRRAQNFPGDGDTIVQQARKTAEIAKKTTI